MSVRLGSNCWNNGEVLTSTDLNDTFSNVITADGISNEVIEHEIEIIELQASAAKTPFDHDTMVSDTFSDSNGYNNYVNTGNTTALFSTNKYVRRLTESNGLVVGGGIQSSFDIDMTSKKDGYISQVKVKVDSTIVGTPSIIITNSSAVEIYNQPFSIPAGPVNTTYTFNLDPADYTQFLTAETFNLKITNTSNDTYRNTNTFDGLFFAYTTQVVPAADTDMITFTKTGTDDDIVEINLPTISGTVLSTQLITRTTSTATSNLNYELEDSSANIDTDLVLDTKNDLVNLVSNPTILRLRLDNTDYTELDPQVNTWCLKLWKSI